MRLRCCTKGHYYLEGEALFCTVCGEPLPPPAPAAAGGTPPAGPPSVPQPPGDDQPTISVFEQSDDTAPSVPVVQAADVASPTPVAQASDLGQFAPVDPGPPAPAPTKSAPPVPTTQPASQAAVPTPPLEDARTVAVFDIPVSADLVVGWLVCCKGSSYGQSFELKSGRNNIGRSLDMTIALSKEPTVSRVRHCIIVFEPEQQDFLIQSGEGSGLTYVNGELLMGHRTLAARDQIRLGACELIFFPLCGEDFSWKEILVS